ncbi:DinB family protein [Cesiribacter sp. SM1]|uniref:DinB family protein n=1 Tax=Cesiribacter sp. SM1 TaxID=2861196 RepID=UPI001CD7A25E|nr:DinB family protein [Cesiribacter sp. SM1]
MKAHFLKLLNYNTWANRRFLSCLQDNTVVNNKVFLLLSHILTSEEVWLCRVKGVEAPVQRLWEIYPNATLPLMLEENSSQWLEFLNNCSNTDFDQEAVYKNTKGESFSTRLDDIITHMVNHGSHHRAQIASMLRQEKIQPPAGDYIVYIRELKPALV